MVERTPILNFITHALLLIGAFITLLPFIIVTIAATHSLREVNQVPMPLWPGHDFFANMKEAWMRADLGTKLLNSLIFGAGLAFGKVVISAISAYSLVFFGYRGRVWIFWAIFITLMLPLEVRIVPTYAVATNALSPYQAILDGLGITSAISMLTGTTVDLQWNLLNSYPGLILPFVATATGTFLYRQHFMTLPEELVEAAKMDGAGALRFFWDILLPLSRNNMAALFTIMFVWGWNQYLWPLIVTTEPSHIVSAVGLQALIPGQNGIPEWNLAMAGTLLVMLPPLILVIFMQRFFVRGLVATEK
ncbi:sn-glycerol-3-phosphate transport system permease protein UgpE [Labrys miyagiensis]|uniref:sn-glycerol-3-phosphate transport system permease protein UgpE n=1 Tax=Labrys miyagiensis TaxID=346912 RepID=A0ABQ6CU71_9HYPH|nr:ABC transporter permease subunit [Labrys miyagiensis]GLS23913.1 sn-glycerol-3-phosphate transport system permease protein UgpE [Labrys miyagiensis]